MPFAPAPGADGWPDLAARARALGGGASRWGRRLQRGVRQYVPWSDLLVHAGFVLAAVLLLLPTLRVGAIHWQDDTKYFYYPLLANLADALKEGRLPLWEPGIFGGYPLFADGESGMLYPFHLVVLRLLEPAPALIVLRLIRFYLAGAFAYAFLRATGARRTGSATGALTFMLSGFMVSQIVHENLDSGMVWLPLALYFVERAVRTPAPRRYLLASFAGVALAMQALAVHVQVCLFTAMMVFPYLGWRVLFADTFRAALPGRLLIGTGLATVMGLVAAGLSAVQMLPLLDLADRSARGHGIGLGAATINSVTPFRLLTILFPHLLKRPDGAGFGYWIEWEVTVYVGIPALMLAGAAVALRRDRYSVFFGAAAILALVLSLGRYGPPWVVLVTQDLLGDQGLRSPGRFAFLWSFSTAVLAGLGVDWLERRAAGAGGRPLRWTTLRRLGALRRRSLRRWPAVAGHLLDRLSTVLVLGAIAGASVALLLGVGTAHHWLVEHPAEAQSWIERQYITFDPTARLTTSTGEVYRSLVASLDAANPYTRVWALSVAGGYALLVTWLVGAGRFRRTRRPPGALFSVPLRLITTVMVALPLLAAARQAHPATTMRTVVPDSPSAMYLRGRLAPPGAPRAARPLYRTYTSQPIYLYQSDVEPNVLLPLGIQEAGGYSSLSTEPSLAYAWAAETTQSRMMDAWNVGYFLWPNRPESQPSHGLTSFHPQRPLLSGAAVNAGAVATFRVPSLPAQNVRLVATLRDAWDLPRGTTVGWVVATDDAGQDHRWPLRAGIEVDEASRPLPAGFSAAKNGPVTPDTPELESVLPLPTFQLPEYGADGKPYGTHLYYAELALPEERTLVRLRVQPATVPEAPHVILRVHGLGVGLPDWSVHNLLWSDRERYTLVHEDEETRVYRNERALPRAYLVPVAVPAWKETHNKVMGELGFDPERMLLVHAPPDAPLEGPTAGAWYEPAGGPPPGAPETAASPDTVGVTVEDPAGRVAVSAAGRAVLTGYASERVTIEVNAPESAWLLLADTFDPNWRAYVDGSPRPIHLANALSRAVAVPAGAHTVEFRYEPAPLARGAAVSLVTGSLVLLATVAFATAGVIGRLRRRQTAAAGRSRSGANDASDANDSGVA